MLAVSGRQNGSEDPSANQELIEITFWKSLGKYLTRSSDRFDVQSCTFSDFFLH